MFFPETRNGMSLQTSPIICRRNFRLDCGLASLVVKDAILFLLRDFGEVGSNGQADACAWRSSQTPPGRADRPEAIEASVSEVNARKTSALFGHRRPVTQCFQ
jgi:hypothetical protein